MKLSFWDVLTGILMFAGFGVVLVFANIFIDPYTILNPFPPPTLQPTLKIPTSTPTPRSLPEIWTMTPTGNVRTTTLLPSLTPVFTRTGFVLPSGTATSTATPIPSLTPVKSSTPTRTNTPIGGKTSTPTRTRTPTSSTSFAVTSVRNIAASPSSWSAACPYSINLTADIVSNDDGTVTFYWIRRTTGGTFIENTPQQSVDFSAAGTISVSTNITGSTSHTSTYNLYINNPNHQEFGGLTLSVTCGVSITSNGGGATAAINVAENTTAVTTVTTNPTGSTFSITGGADAADFSINASTGVLTFNVAPNYESPHDADTNNTYIVTVHAVNGSATDDQTITVTVTDVNEFTPVITSNGGGATASINVPENTIAVTTVTATDGDGTASLTYSITGGTDASRFSINSSSGVLTFNTAPNFESPNDSDTNNTYVVIVQVSDGTNTATQTITVTVTDVNEAPTITSNGGGATANISVAENTTAVTTVTATDPDAGASLTYSISAGDDAARFSINAGTGVLTFNSAPDYETPTDSNTDNSYVVTVQVSDGTNTDTQIITVYVTDVNDNDPVITSNGGGATAAISLPENQGFVTTVTATDADAGTTITYSIIGGTDETVFDIDSSTGELGFFTPPDFESPIDSDMNNVYEVIVQASDGTRTDTQTITITITNVDPES